MTDLENPARSCANCACHFVQENRVNKLEKQSFCRRDTPMAAKMRSQRPAMLLGKPRMDKAGRPIMEEFDDVIYLYKPTMPNLVCFDGWRPEGTLPGERSGSEMGETLMRSMRQLFQDMMNPEEASLRVDVMPEDFTPLYDIDDSDKKN